MAKYRIPFNRPSLAGNELRYIEQALASGHISGDGQFTLRCRAMLEDSLGCHRALLTTSCTHALEMAALLLDLQLGDEVIIPSFTFVSTANAFVLRGARPVFADVDPDTLNVDTSSLRALTTERTKAIVVVHYGGLACDMDRIMDTAHAHGVCVIEDNAHGLYGSYRGRSLGSIGALGTLSFHETKNFTCGEGGALLVNDPRFTDRAEIIREKGTNRARFFRGQVDKYTWVDVGSSYLPSEVCAAYLAAQLEERSRIQAARAHRWQTYLRELRPTAEARGWGLPVTLDECEHAYHLFFLLLRSDVERSAFIAHMAARGVLCVFHYVPLHLSPMGVTLGGRRGQCPVTEDVSARLVRLPLFSAMSDDEQQFVIDAIVAFETAQ